MPSFGPTTLTTTDQTFVISTFPADSSPRITFQAVGADPLFDGSRVLLEFAADGANFRPLPDVEISGARMTAGANVEGPGALRLRMVGAGPRTSVSVQSNVVA